MPMPPEIEKLLVLQDRDQKIRALRLDQRVIPQEEAALEAKLAAARALLDQARQRVRENEVERRKLELEVEGKQTAIARFRTQQQQTRKNEEFQGLASEIKHFEGDIAALEDREIVYMEAAERLQQESLTADGELKRVEAIVAKEASSLKARGSGLGARLSELETDRAALAANITPDTLSLYDRLLAKKGDAAVVSVEHEICSGCHMRAPTQVVIHLRAGQGIIQCPNCARILYREL